MLSLVSCYGRCSFCRAYLLMRQKNYVKPQVLMCLLETRLSSSQNPLSNLDIIWLLLHKVNTTNIKITLWKKTFLGFNNFLRFKLHVREITPRNFTVSPALPNSSPIRILTLRDSTLETSVLGDVRPVRVLPPANTPVPFDPSCLSRGTHTDKVMPIKRCQRRVLTIFDIISTKKVPYFSLSVA